MSIIFKNTKALTNKFKQNNTKKKHTRETNDEQRPPMPGSTLTNIKIQFKNKNIFYTLCMYTSYIIYFLFLYSAKVIKNRIDRQIQYSSTSIRHL